jgi:signal peptidase I
VKQPLDNLSRDERTETSEAAPIYASPQADREHLGDRDASQIRSWVWDLMVSVIASVFIIFFLYQPVHVEGTSMLPRLEDQDLLLINKFAYTKLGGWMGDEIRRGDVVVFRYPHDETKSYIKRVIALPGDRLQIDHGTVILNGAAQTESYVPVKYQDDRSMAEEIIPPGEYFVMGDHRSISSDSRDFGAVQKRLVYGKAAFVYWPVDQAGVVH